MDLARISKFQNGSAGIFGWGLNSKGLGSKLAKQTKLDIEPVQALAINVRDGARA